VTSDPPRQRERNEPPNRKGWMKLRRGLPETEGDIPTSETQWNYERLVSRVNPNGAWVLVYVLDRTQSGFAGRGIPPPEYSRIDIDAVADFLNVTPRHVRGIITSLIRLEVLASRCPQDRWAVKALPENFEKLPVLGATKRPGRPCKPQMAAVPTPASLAAYRQSPAATPTETDNCPPTAETPTREEQTKVTEMDFPDIRQIFAVPGECQADRSEGHRQGFLEGRHAALIDAARIAEQLGHADVHDAILRLVESRAKTEEIRFHVQDEVEEKSVSADGKFTSGLRKSGVAPVEVNFRDPELKCPLNLGCPYLANDLADDKPLALIKLTSQPAGWPAGPTIDDVRAYLGRADVPRYFTDVPTERIFRETHANLQGAPLESLKQRIDRRGPALRSMGAIPLLAKDVGDRWKAEESARIEAERLRRSSEFHRLLQALRDRREQLHNDWEALQQIVG
jgi:hypothetical protein